MLKKLLLARPSHVPEGAASLFADYIHPAFRGTSVAFHTLRLLKHFRAASRDNAKGPGGDATTPKHPYTHGGDLAAMARSVLQGKHETKAGAYGSAPRNPFRVLGEWFKKLRGDGVVSVPDHLHDLADKYNYGTADRRHALDAKLYDMVHAIHGKGDHAATDLKLRDIGRKLLTATEDQKRGLTAAVKKQLRAHPLPADWHEELLNSLSRLHQYALDRQMLKEEAHEKVRTKIVGPGKREGNISWRDWFMGASRDGKRGDPMRLYRDEEALPSLLAQVLAGEDHLSPILADAVEGAQREHDPESLAAMRSGKPHTIREVGGKIWAREKLARPLHGYPDHHIVHHAHGPGGEFVISTDGVPHGDFGNYYVAHERHTFDGPGKPWHGDSYWNLPRHTTERNSPHRSSGFGEEFLAATKAHLDALAAGPVQLSRVTQGIGAALRELASRNQKAREQAARALLKEAGEPGAVASVIAHHPETGYRAAVLATLAAGDHYTSDAARYLGAWHGSLTKEPRTVAFHAHDDGQDRLHILHAPTDPATLAEALKDAGVHRFSIRPSQGRSTAFVFDRGGMFDLTPLAGRLNGRSVHSSGTGHRLGESAGADGAAAYRDHIRDSEADAGAGGTGPEAQRVPAAGRLKLARPVATPSVWQTLPGDDPDSDTRVHHFTVSDGREFRSMVTPVDVDDHGIEGHHFEFKRLRGAKDPYKLSGEGLPHEVMRHVANGLAGHLLSRQPPMVRFTADESEPSRVRLYEAAVARAHLLHPDYVGYMQEPEEPVEGIGVGTYRKPPRGFYLVHRDHARQFERNHPGKVQRS